MISIIIPVYNDLKIKDCLDSICAQSYDNKEIIVVDNNSNDPGIKNVIAQFPQVTYIFEAKPGSYTARNTGAKHARGDRLVFTDSDCITDINWLKNISHYYDEQKIIMGKIQSINHNKIATFEDRLYNDVIKDKRNNSRIDTRNFIIDKYIFQKIKGFNENLKYGGDMELGARLAEAGYNIQYYENIVIKHVNETNFEKTIAKRIKQNYDNYNILKYHDIKFITKYFPHLLEFKPGVKSTILRILLKIILKLNAPFLPLENNYYCYKKINTIAMKYGLLSNVVQKNI